MAFESEELRKRQERRRIEKQRRLEKQKRFRHRMTIGLIIAAVVLALCGILIIVLQNDAPPPPPVDETTAPTAPTEPQTVISLAFGGDLNITDKVVASGVTEQGYDFAPVFRDIMPLLAGADATVLNLEGNLIGEPYGSQNASAPPALLEALSAAGVDMLQMANSYTVANGLLGLNSTLDAIRQAGMESVGAFASSAEFEATKGYTLRSVNGVKVAFVAFTKGVGNLGMPEGSENQVNLLYSDYTSTYQEVDTEGIRKVLRAVANEQPDFTVALLHWGSEYNNQISDSQEKIAKLMLEEGVDAIVGNHSHFVQPIVHDKQAGTVVAYSLGDFLGDCPKSGTEYSAILQLQVTKDNTTGQTTLTSVDYAPIYTLRTETESTVSSTLLRIQEAIEAYEADSIDRVSQSVYKALKAALSNLESRTAPPKK